MPADLLRERLYVGDAASSMAPDCEPYDLLVNVTREVPFSACLRDAQRTERFDVLDDPDNPNQAEMAAVCRAAVPLVRRALAAGDTVLVFCLEGKQRSCTVAAAYLMDAEGLSAREAVREVRRHRRPAWDHGQYVHYAEVLGLPSDTGLGPPSDKGTGLPSGPGMAPS